MPRKTGIPTITGHLEHLSVMFDSIEKYGLCDVTRAELAKAKIVNAALLKKKANAKARAAIRAAQPAKRKAPVKRKAPAKKKAAK